MRPIELELAGFASFRDPVLVDFRDADLFALTGPTGAGKSSLIDALTFALYGSVPRYDDRRLVEPVISQGRTQARVRLAFSIGDQEYTAVRVVRRTSAGRATTKEARLEQGDEILAGTADEVTQRVQDLLGLSFEHFVKCVVLPQGSFAQFLHDKPKKRQDLLVELLDVPIYRRMAKLAGLRARTAEARIEIHRQRLEGELRRATPDALEEARLRAEALGELLARIEGEAAFLRELRTRVEKTAADAESCERWIEKLDALAPPEDVDTLADSLRVARTEEEVAAEALARSAESLASAQSALEGLPSSADLTRWKSSQRELRDLQPDLDRIEAELSAHRLEEDRLSRESLQLEGQLEEAHSRVRTTERRQRAADLAAGLGQGDACPICERPLEKEPAQAPSPDAELARSKLAECSAAIDRHRAAQLAAQHRRSGLEAQLDAARSRFRRLEDDLSEAPDATQLLALDQQRTNGETNLQAARESQRTAIETLEHARRKTATEERRLPKVWRQFDRARDELAALGPPEVPRESPAAAWKALEAWAIVRTEELTLEAAESREASAAAHADLAARELQLRVEARALGVEADSTRVRDLVADAAARAANQAEGIEQAIAEADRLRQEMAAAEKTADVGRHLARHLGTRRFEAWFLHRALQRLLASASHLLRQLSSGQYSLAVDEKSSNFLVVDHSNADELRLARTLSGGETFLASLALALALAEDIVRLGSHGGARLEALFLDEGFGTLDTETLEVVASALDELGARGRMVGLVTHVPELAERIPVRFEVRKGSRSSSVERRTG